MWILEIILLDSGSKTLTSDVAQLPDKDINPNRLK